MTNNIQQLTIWVEGEYAHFVYPKDLTYSELVTWLHQR